jgi:hypothetical protein
MSTADLYSDQIKKHFKIFYANWEPGGPIELGQYGILQGNIFIPVGKLEADFPQEFPKNTIQLASDPTKDQKEFKSERGVEVTLNAKGTLNAAGVPLAKAGLEIKFTKEDSIFFNAAECTTTRISNKAKIGETIKTLFKANKWRKEYCVVTDVVTAGKTIIAVSRSSNSAITFEAETPGIEKIDLADASIKLGLKTEKNIGYKVDAKDGLNILIGLCKIKNPFPWNGPVFKPQKMKMTKSMHFRIENEPQIKTEASPDELYFGQLGME